MKFNIREIILVAIFAVLTAVGAIVTIPVGVIPMTFQLLFTLSAGVFLGARLGALSQIIYVLIGLIGVPVFANGGSGLHYAIEPSFGYLLGFITGAYLTGKLCEISDRSRRGLDFINISAACLAGMMVSYIFGITYLYIIKNVRFGANISIFKAVALGTAAFIWKDIILCFVIAGFAISFLKIVRKTIPAGYLSLAGRRRNQA